MTVQELIAELSRLDPQKEVRMRYVARDVEWSVQSWSSDIEVYENEITGVDDREDYVLLED